MKKNEKFDICVIGAGSAGLSVAAAAASFGQKVVLIEKGKMGGDCLNTGCVPSKSLLAAAKHAYAFSSGEEFGIKPAKPKVDFARVNDHVKGVIASIGPHDSVERFEGLGVKVIQATGKFVDARTVKAAGEKISARRFVIATGSTAAAPPIPGLEKVDFLTNENIFQLRECPKRLIIIGGGPIGMEMAKAHSRLGSTVTVLEAFDPLGKDDPEHTTIVLEKLKAEGIEILSRVKIRDISQTAKGIKIKLEDAGIERQINGSHLMVAAGRRVNVEGLDLEKAGIKYSKRGIKVDKGLCTTNRNVYAIGDVAGGMQFTHVAGYHAGLVVKNILFRLPINATTNHVPWVTYTDPELAHVGLSAAMAEKQGLTHKVLKWSFAENDRARAERATDGLITVVIAGNSRILGATITAPNAGELIQPWALAISSKLKIKAMIDQIVAYPTWGEVNRRVAITAYAGFPSKPIVRRVINWLKVFG
jgi:pyruvate/2-oxoglutarate dehydrogenase complex dihydrolipoamide dehydrogenase (E3) component